MPSITNHHVLIIGGTSGIGFAAAGLALSSGCTVSIASSNPSRVSPAILRLQTSFPDQKTQISGHEIDLSTPDIEARLSTLFSTVTSNHAKPLDHIIYTAGRAPQVKPLSETDIVETLKSTQFFYAAPLAIAKLAPA